MTGTLEDEIRKVREQASILADETRQKVTGALEDEIRKAREQANIFGEAARVIRESIIEPSKAASERLKKTNEHRSHLRRTG